MINKSEKSLSMGARYPFDAPDHWWSSGNTPAPLATDWAHRAARGVIAELKGRRGIKHGFDGISEKIREEIVSMIAEIIRLSEAERHATTNDPRRD